ncbi:MAG: hypothetical protein ACRD4F_16975 [Candidatus Angelobacter sp.]
MQFKEQGGAASATLRVLAFTTVTVSRTIEKRADGICVDTAVYLSGFQFSQFTGAFASEYTVIIIHRLFLFCLVVGPTFSPQLAAASISVASAG